MPEVYEAILITKLNKVMCEIDNFFGHNFLQIPVLKTHLKIPPLLIWWKQVVGF